MIKNIIKPTLLKIILSIAFVLVFISLPNPPFSADVVNTGMPFVINEFSGFHLMGSNEICNIKEMGECEATFNINYLALVVDILIAIIISFFIGFILNIFLEKYPKTKFIMLSLVVIVLFFIFFGLN